MVSFLIIQEKILGFPVPQSLGIAKAPPWFSVAGRAYQNKLKHFAEKVKMFFVTEKIYLANSSLICSGTPNFPMETELLLRLLLGLNKCIFEIQKIKDLCVEALHKNSPADLT